ncbi:hypothetical protein KQX54_005426 [Cotesia glomerata]|uniref:MADS-box domain-containing protein n=1 Tax=Cotesia glomerata TaxID=32391 RepID=A0AAV7ITH5_COTGL|nr:hypothetical protein KQX54_005426 [Cotesia glomerata]
MYLGRLKRIKVARDLGLNERQKKKLGKRLTVFTFLSSSSVSIFTANEMFGFKNEIVVSLYKHRMALLFSNSGLSEGFLDNFEPELQEIILSLELPPVSLMMNSDESDAYRKVFDRESSNQSSATVTHTLTSTIQTAPNLQLTAHPMTEAPKIYSTPITSSTVTNTVTSSSTADTPKTIASPITHKITSTTTAHTTTTTTTTTSSEYPINSTVLNNTSRASSEYISSPLEMNHDLVMDYFNNYFSAPIEEKKTEHSKSSSKPVQPNTHSPNSGLLDAKRKKKISLKNDDIQNI